MPQPTATHLIDTSTQLQHLKRSNKNSQYTLVRQSVQVNVHSRYNWLEMMHWHTMTYIIGHRDVYIQSHQNFGLNIFYSEEKDWARHTTRQCPLQRKYLQKNLITHTHTHFQE